MTSIESIPPRTRAAVAPLRIAMLGTRGVPAAYGGFETAIEEVGRRLVENGHDVTVYGRGTGGRMPKEYLGMRLVTLPALRSKTMETLSHTALSATHLTGTRRHDVAFVFNAANAPFVPLIRARGTAVALHVDGLEWQREKWGRLGRRYYRAAEQIAVREADALISDAVGIQDYYDAEFGIPTELITYGARIIEDSPSDRVRALGLAPGGYHLVVARFEPENHVDVVVEGYHRSNASLPLVVVGSAPYAHEYTQRIQRIAQVDDRIVMLGGVWDQDLLDQLYANALSYLHGHSVGGTNPSLLRAMGAGTAVVGWDVVFNREVAGDAADYFRTPAELAERVERIEQEPDAALLAGAGLRERAAELYDWDDVARGYEELASRIAGGFSTRGMSDGRRTASAWSVRDRPAGVLRD